MKWVVIGVRTLVGLVFVVTGLNELLPQRFLDIPPPETEEAKAFLTLLNVSHYLVVVKVLELVGGLLLLSGRAAPLGITLLMPVAVNIFLYEMFLLHKPGPGGVLVALLAFLIWGYRAYFAPVFTLSACVSCGRPRVRDAGWDVAPGGGKDSTDR